MPTQARSSTTAKSPIAFRYVSFAAVAAALFCLGSCTLVADFPSFGDAGPGTCGNGLVEEGEECDGNDLGSKTCESIGHYPGILACSDCVLDTSGCGGFCGDGILQADFERCDGSELGGATCERELSGSHGGLLLCDQECSFDTSLCNLCGNGLAESWEACDGTDLRGDTCTSLGLGEGTLSCRSNCSLNTTACGYCGDAICNALGTETAATCPGDCRWTAIAAGSIGTCGLRANGSLWCWGSGPALSSPTHIPVRVDTGVSFVKLAAGRQHFCAISTLGDVFCWGAGLWGQIGDGGTDSTSEPTQVSLAGATAVALGLGQDHSCAVMSDATVFCWGANIDGSLGRGYDPLSPAQGTTPMQVVNLSDVVAVTGGYAHTCAVDAWGAAWCWGSGWLGELGDGLQTSSATPVQVMGVSDASTISAGTSFSCVVLGDGNVRCWGDNSVGQLGDGSLVSANTPVSAATLGQSMVDIAAGWNHVCAVGVDESTYCWGDSGRGKLGHGLVSISCTGDATPMSIAPVVMMSTDEILHSFEITAGQDHSCAVLPDGLGMCWGYAGEDQLGITASGPQCYSKAQALAN